MNRPAKSTRFAFFALVVGLLANAAIAFAAADYSGRIGRIDVRTGHADTAVYRNAIIIRDEASSVVCVLAAGVENYTEFLSTATAAMLAGKNVVIARGGALNGQFKCYQINVAN
jgi:hypothetical protein